MCLGIFIPVSDVYIDTNKKANTIYQNILEKIEAKEETETLMNEYYDLQYTLMKESIPHNILRVVVYIFECTVVWIITNHIYRRNIITIVDRIVGSPFVLFLIEYIADIVRLVALVEHSARHAILIIYNIDTYAVAIAEAVVVNSCGVLLIDSAINV